MISGDRYTIFPAKPTVQTSSLAPSMKKESLSKRISKSIIGETEKKRNSVDEAHDRLPRSVSAEPPHTRSISSSAPSLKKGFSEDLSRHSEKSEDFRKREILLKEERGSSSELPHAAELKVGELQRNAPHSEPASAKNSSKGSIKRGETKRKKKSGDRGEHRVVVSTPRTPRTDSGEQSREHDKATMPPYVQIINTSLLLFSID